jgi:hypothetical protein
VALRALPDHDALYGVVFDPAPTNPATGPGASTQKGSR